MASQLGRNTGASWPDLGDAAGATQVNTQQDTIAAFSDDANSRYRTGAAVADATLTTFDHDFGVAFSELNVLVYTGTHPSLTRVADPAAAGWVIAANGTNPLTQIDVTTPGSGGPHDFAVMIIQGRGAESIDDLDDVDLSTPPAAAQVLKYDGANWVAGSVGGLGEVNFIENSGAETNAAGWSVYNDTPGGSEPIDGDGGTASVTFTRQDSVVLRGEQSFQLSKGASDLQGEGVSYDFEIGEQDRSRKCKIQFDFKTNEDAAFAQGDLKVFIYDVDNSTLITPVDTDIPDTAGIFQTSWNSTSSTNYRLIFHIATTNASAYDVYLDNVIVGPGMTSQGAAIGGWKDYSSELTPPANSSVSAQYRRVGETMEILWNQTCTGGSTASSLILPSGFTINTSLIGTSQSRDLAHGTYLDSGIAFYEVVAKYSTPTTLDLRYDNGTNLATVPGLTNADQINLFASLPITEWEGQGIVPMLAEDNLSVWQSYTSSLTNITIGNGSQSFWYRRVGDSMEINGLISFGSTTSVTGTLVFSLPSGLNMDGSKLSGSNAYVGAALANDASPDGGYNGAILRNSTSTTEFRIYGGNGDTLWNATTPFTWATSDTLRIHTLKVPIVEWAGSQNSLVGYSQADGTNTGLLPPVASMSDALATQLGYKEYRETDVTFSSVPAGWSSPIAYLVPYQTSDGNWRLRYTIQAVTSSLTTQDFKLDGITSPGGIWQAGSHAGDTTGSYHQFDPAGTMICRRTTAATNVRIFGDIRLGAKPTWAV